MITYSQNTNPIPGQPRFEAAFNAPEVIAEFPNLRHVVGTGYNKVVAARSLLAKASEMHPDFSWPFGRIPRRLGA